MQERQGDLHHIRVQVSSMHADWQHLDQRLHACAEGVCITGTS